MAIGPVPFALQNASHSASVFRIAQSAPFTSGGILAANELPVSQQGTPNMSVILGPGRAQIVGTSVSPPSGQVWTTQAQYNAYNDANLTLTVTASNPTNPRIDAVYVQAQDAFYTGSTNTAVAGVVAGTPAVSPVAPSVPVNSILIAYIAVAANATTIVTANISYQAAVATLVGTSNIAKSGSTMLVPSSTVVGSGSFVQSLLGTVTVTAASSVSLNGVLVGYDNYRVVYNFSSSSAAANIFFKVRASGTDLAAGYFQAYMQLASATPNYAYSTTATQITVGDVNGSGQGGFGSIDLYGPSLAQHTGIIFDNTCQTVYTRGTGNVPNTTIYDGITLAASSGTLTGTIRVYGWNNG